MTEKRFTIVNMGLDGRLIKEDGKIIELERVVDLLNENEQLKQVIKAVYELLTIEVDVFSDKATEHDINAYRELQQLDNKDAFFMATATKKAIKLLKGDV